MIRRLIGPIVVFLLVSLTSVVLHFFDSKRDEARRLSTSNLESAKGSIRIGLDGYAGYVPFRAPEFRNRLLEDGYRLELFDDQGDYAKRVDSLANGSLDLAVFTVDSYVLNGVAEDYPGSIIAVLSESTGSDGIVSSDPGLKDLDGLKAISDLKIAFTPNSPSEHLLKAIATDFGLQELLQGRSWQRRVTGSEEALKTLKQGEVQAAVLWEPELSKAKADESLHYLIGSESARGLIVDVLVASPSILNEKPEVAEKVLESYFKQLADYRRDRAGFIEALSRDTNTSQKVAEQIAQGIAWKGYEANKSVWLGNESGVAGSDGFRLYDSIERTIRVLTENGDFRRSELPQGDPRSLIFGTPLRSLASSATFNASASGAESVELLAQDFPALSAEQWEQLPKVGTLKLRPISFQSGTNRLSDTAIETIGRMLESLKNYPDFRVVISGHTSSRGDPDANRDLSRARAEAVVEYIVRQFAMDADRLRAIGHGSDRPLARLPNESFRAHQNRLARVEFSFVRDSL